MALNEIEQIAELRSVVADVGLTTMLANPSCQMTLRSLMIIQRLSSITQSLQAMMILIEKEWVDKAKKIVESTKNDPLQT